MDEVKDECCNEQPQPDCCNDGCNTVSDSGLGGNVLCSSGGTYNYNISSMSSIHYAPDYNPKPTKMKNVVIKQMDYGFLVKIGCQTLCIESPKKLLKALKKYMKDPEGVEQLHTQGEFMECLD